jgi:hypothetical protein
VLAFAYLVNAAEYSRTKGCGNLEDSCLIWFLQPKIVPCKLDILNFDQRE